MGALDARSPVLDPHRVAAAHRATAVVADAEPGLVRLTRLARDLLDVSAALVTVVSHEHEVLRAVIGLPRPFTSGSTVPLSLSLCVRLVETGSAVLLDDLRDDPVLRGHPAVLDLGLHSYAGVPLHVGRQVVGGLCVLSERARTWTEADLRLLTDLGGAISTELQLRSALQQLDRSRDAEQRLAAEQAALSRVATAVARGQGVDQVLASAAGEAVGLLGADSVVVVRFRSDGRADVVAAAGASEPDAGLCNAVLADLRRTRAATSLPDAAAPCRAVPVLLAGRLWGAVIASGGPPGDPPTAQLARLTDLLGVCVGNAASRDRLVELARTDPLTGAANRRAFTERLAEELERAQRHGTSTTLALLDVDCFKSLNDRHGHVTGDRVLVELVARVTSVLRTGDALARLGGDEFAVVLPETDYAAASVVLDRIGHAVQDVPLGGQSVTATLGAAVLDSGQAAAEELYRLADAALYRAKAGGRGSVVLERLQ